MTNREAINIITAKMDVHQAVFGHPVDEPLKTAYEMAISALEKQEQSCDTCRHGRFGDKACINCRVGFPNHYEAEEEA